MGARSVHNLPVNRGFDYHFGFLGGGEHHFTQQSYECNEYVDLWENSAPAYSQNGTAYSCELYGSKAVGHIESHDASVPLFLYLAFHDVHEPNECPSKFFDPSIGFKPRQVAAGMSSCVSIATGNVTDALKRQGMWNHTLMVWAADNGGLSLGTGNNFPLRGGKASNWSSCVLMTHTCVPTTIHVCL